MDIKPKTEGDLPAWRQWWFQLAQAARRIAAPDKPDDQANGRDEDSSAAQTAR